MELSVFKIFVELSLPEFHATVLFTSSGYVYSFPSAQQAWRSWSQGNLRGRSLKGPQSATTGWHT